MKMQGGPEDVAKRVYINYRVNLIFRLVALPFFLMGSGNLVVS